RYLACNLSRGHIPTTRSGSRWLQLDLKPGKVGRAQAVKAALKILKEIILPRLPEGEPIYCQAALKPRQSGDLPTKRQHWNAAFDPDRPLVDPVRNEVRVDLCLSTSLVEHERPGIGRCLTPTADGLNL